MSAPAGVLRGGCMCRGGGGIIIGACCGCSYCAPAIGAPCGERIRPFCMNCGGVGGI